jgi:hypothetical protein
MNELNKGNHMNRIIPVFFAAVFCSSSVAQPVTVTLAAAADNSIYEIPAANSNAIGQNIFSGTNGGGSPRRGLIKFNIAAVVPANAIITAASLTLNCNLSRPQPDNVNLHKLTTNWGEGTSNAGGGSGDGAGVPATANDATWVNNFFPGSNWINQGGDFVATSSAVVSITGTGFYTWAGAAMIADVQSWLNTPADNFGWILICNETIISTARKFGSRENTTVANRPALTITYTTTLPITLTSFTGTVAGNTATLQWTTAQEINNSHFEILQSTDGVTFYNIGKVPGNGTTVTANTYKFVHTAVNNGILFYRLAQVDYDGKKMYSTVVKITIAADVYRYKPLGNIVNQTIVLNNSSSFKKVLYAIYNRQGQLLVSSSITSNIIPVAKLAAGVYYLCIYPADKSPERYQFVKL